ncbi:endonuclease Q family protein [Elusimicrobiota bacterium]
MRFICDFHIHSHYSIATSKNLIPEYLDVWARIKGIRVLGTGDFTHPGWINELKEKLEPDNNGLFKLKKQYSRHTHSGDTETRFILTSEISSIYKKNDQVRKVHNLIISPDYETVQKIRHKLSGIGNISSDGRPILKLDSRDLLEIVLESSDNSILIPAHIWTPWFSVLGSKSGFNSIQECYDDLTRYIYAVETGLSSDPPMNWKCSFLDKYTIISNSDAHSPEKLAREANIFNTELSYDSIISALKTGDPEKFLGTIEFFAQEGKYHYDGHRKCGVCLNPLKTKKYNRICPVCGKQVVRGVLNRVMELSDRTNTGERPNRHPFYSIIPLKEILSEISARGPDTKQVGRIYNDLIKKSGSELNLLIDMPQEDIKNLGNEMLAEGIRRMRSNEVIIREGYDGEYGSIELFDKKEKHSKLTADIK